MCFSVACCYAMLIHPDRLRLRTAALALRYWSMHTDAGFMLQASSETHDDMLLSITMETQGCHQRCSSSRLVLHFLRSRRGRCAVVRGCTSRTREGHRRNARVVGCDAYSNQSSRRRVFLDRDRNAVDVVLGSDSRSSHNSRKEHSHSHSHSHDLAREKAWLRSGPAAHAVASILMYSGLAPSF